MKASYPARAALALAMVLTVPLAGSGGAAYAGERPHESQAAAVSTTVDAETMAAFFGELVPALLAEHQLPGAAVVVVRGEEEIFAGGYGLADVATGRPVDPARTAFPIDSVTKLVTATAVMQLVEAGVVDLHTDVNEYLHDLQLDVAEPVTLAHLLTHTAGFEEQYIGLMTADPASDEPLHSVLADHPAQVRAPGTYAGYSNHGLALVGLVVEQQSRLPYGEYVTRHVLEPLGMTRSGFPPALAAEVAANLVGRYRVVDGEQRAWQETGDRLPPAGAMSATVTDMGRFMRAHLAGGSVDGGRILAADTIDEMHRRQFAHDPRLPGIGLGFIERTIAGTPLVGHGGDGLGSHSLLALAPGHDLGVYAVVNGDGVDEGGLVAVEALVEQFVTRFAATEPAQDWPADPAPTGTVADDPAGTYRATRISHSDFSELFSALFTDVTVVANDDGTVTTTGLAHPSGRYERRWEPLSEGVYQEAGHEHIIVFAGERLFYSDDPTMAWQRLPWYQSPMLHLAIAGIGMLLLVSSLVWPVVGLVRRIRSGGHHSERPLLARGARWVAVSTVALVVGFLAGLVALAADADRLVFAVLTDAPVLRAMLAPMALAVLPTVATAVLAGLAWRLGWWSRWGRIHYTAVALGAAMVVAVAHRYHLTILW